jgi:hypothetical protein
MDAGQTTGGRLRDVSEVQRDTLLIEHESMDRLEFVVEPQTSLFHDLPTDRIGLIELCARRGKRNAQEVEITDLIRRSGSAHEKAVAANDDDRRNRP